MSLFVNSDKLTVLKDLPFIPRITYRMSIKPYIDKETGIAGIKRKMQVISKLGSLLNHSKKIGLTKNMSTQFNLISNYNLVLRDRSVQNKADRDLTPQADTRQTGFESIKSRVLRDIHRQADMGKTPQADIPLNNNYIYIFLYTNFEKFLELHPIKKDKPKAFEIFQKINPNPHKGTRKTCYQKMLCYVT